MSQDAWQSNLEIERAQLRDFARSMAGVDWLLLALVVIYLLVTRPDLARDPIVVATLGGYAAVLLLLRVAVPLGSKPQRKLPLEILAMITFLTLILSRLDAEASTLVNLYLLPIIAAAIALGKRGTVLVTVLVCACYFFFATVGGGREILSPVLLTQAMSALVPFVLVAVLTSLLAEDIRTAKRRIQALSERDSLTGLLHLQAFMRLAERAHKHSERDAGSYSIMLVDIDRLKQINDTYGHAAGNKALRAVAQALLRVTRSEDIVARFGGEEFVSLLAAKDSVAATEVAQRLRSLAYASTFEVNADIVRIQVSVGVASYPADGATLERVMSAADRAMYRDKELRKVPEGQLVIQKR